MSHASRSKTETDMKSNQSDDTIAELEREVENKELSHLVEEVISREKYQFRLDSIFKRYLTCFDNEHDEMVKKMRRNGERKLERELDLSKILKRLRNFGTAMEYMLTDRQRFLLRFNEKNVIDSNSDLISLDSADSLFTGSSD